MKKGFTLIELLAVIVILAIIAVIAVPIVLNIIDESKDNATLRSADFYLDAVEMSIASTTLKDKNISDGTYNLKDGDICLNNDCSDKLEVEVNGEVPQTGTIKITNGNITELNIMLDEKEIYKNSKNEMVYVKLLDEVCEFKEGTPKTAGAKYECKVDPNRDPYTFYVLTTPTSTDERINLIMDQNINSDGTPAGMTGTTKNGDNVYNLVEWISSEDFIKAGGKIEDWDAFNNIIKYGPITAMNFITEATKNWTNTNELTINTYTDKTGTQFPMKTYNTYARMPIYLSDITKTEVSSKTETNEYLYNSLDFNMFNPPYGYWTLSATSFDFSSAWVVSSGRYVSDGGMFVYLAGDNGVRPVINLKIKKAL